MASQASSRNEVIEGKGERGWVQLRPESFGSARAYAEVSRAVEDTQVRNASSSEALEDSKRTFQTAKGRN